MRALASSVRVAQVLVWWIQASSRFKVAKNDSAAALDLTVNYTRFGW